MDSPRLNGEDRRHTEALAGIGTELPPIIVHRATMRVIDGVHRLSAARLRGDERIKAVLFDGTEQEAYVLSVKANVAHGLPLSATERTRAAERIVAMHPDWSDRAIAASSGLGARTVGSIRRRRAASGADRAGAGSRVGRGGRVRPVDSTTGRLKAVDYLQGRPGASLREIARHAGVSPSTARDVRDRLHRGESPIPVTRRPRPGSDSPPLRSLVQGLASDPSLRFSESGRDLLRWLITHAVQDGEWKGLVDAIPAHSTQVLARIARHCSREWREFADTLERDAA
ncbi:ParB/RepB/Spo0J family partition protein [Actinoplanes cyaneus]|uniref:ParB/RepB/Spo0J family partition protein n=1 Tax=Actinoplanes cyaneus TaxID=52696 RepID=UPI0019447ED2|nr:ParB N-terminal domain-containing protein [Actinoplanes cyaneus]